MNILIPSLGDKIAGPEVWKKDLILELKKEYKHVKEFNSLKISGILKLLLALPKADILHTYNQSLGTILSTLYAKILRKRIIHTVHGNFILENKSKTGIKKLLWNKFNLIAIKNANRVTFPSYYLKNSISSRYPWISNKSIVIPNFIDSKKMEDIKRYSNRELNISNDVRLFVEVTSFNLNEKAKGIDLLVKAFKLYQKKNQKAKLLIIGGGKLLDFYKNKYSSDKIEFLGFRKDVLRIIKSADLFIHISFLETFGLVVLEAMALKKKIISLNSGGLKEVVPQECLVKAKPNLISLKMVKSINSSTKPNYKIFLDKYSSKKVIMEFIKLYEGASNEE